MSFKITFGEAFPCLDDFLEQFDANLILEDCNMFANDYVVDNQELVFDGSIDRISHPGGVYRVDSGEGGGGGYDGDPRPEFADKLKVLLHVLRDKFTLTQENGGLILYREVQRSIGRNHPYYAVILPVKNVAIVVCDEYGQGTRIKRYDSQCSLDYVRNEIAENYRKGALDNVGFTMVPVPPGGYDSEEILYRYFQDLIGNYVLLVDTMRDIRSERVGVVLGADPDTFTGFNEVVECDDVVELNELKANLRDHFNGDDGKLDLERISRSNINALNDKFGRSPYAIANLLNVSFSEGMSPVNASHFVRVLLTVYNSFGDYDCCDESVRKLNILIYPDYLKAALRDHFNGDDGKLDLERISSGVLRSLAKKFGIGSVEIANRLEVQFPKNVTADTTAGFLYVLLKVYDSFGSVDVCDESVRKLNILINPERLEAALRDYFKKVEDNLGLSNLGVRNVYYIIQRFGSSIELSNIINLIELKAALRDYFSGENSKYFDPSKLTAPRIRDLTQDFLIGAKLFSSLLNITIPNSFSVETPSGFAHVLLNVYDSFEGYARCEESVDKLNIFINPERLKAALRTRFSEDDGVLDVSKISSANIGSLKNQFGIGAKEIASRLDLQLHKGIDVKTPFGFAHVLLKVYDSFGDYALCEESIKKLNILINPERLKAALRDYFKTSEDDGVLDVSKISFANIRSLKNQFGIGARAIATRLNIKLPEGMNVRLASGFLVVLNEIYQASGSYIGCKQSQLLLQQMAVACGVGDVFDSKR